MDRLKDSDIKDVWVYHFSKRGQRGCAPGAYVGAMFDVQRRALFVGIKRIVYAALAEDANAEQMIVRGLTLPKFNDQLVRGPFILVAGLRRSEGRVLLRQMGKAAGAAAHLET